MTKKTTTLLSIFSIVLGLYTIGYTQGQERKALVLLKKIAAAKKVNPTLHEGINIVSLTSEGVEIIKGGEKKKIAVGMSFGVDEKSHIATVTDGSGFLVTMPSQNQVLAGKWEKDGSLAPIARFSFEKPSLVKCMRTIEGEICPVVFKDGRTVGLIGVGLDNGLQFKVLRQNFYPSVEGDTLTDVAFSPDGQYIYFGAASSNAGFGRLVACDIAVIMENEPRAGEPSNIGCSVKLLDFVPNQLMVNWDMVGLLNNRIGIKVLLSDEEIDKGYIKRNKILEPKEVENYIPIQGTLKKADYNSRETNQFAFFSPAMGNIIVFGNNNDKESFISVRSTKNVQQLGEQLSINWLNKHYGLISAVSQDPGPLNNDYTSSLNGDFFLFGGENTISILPNSDDYASVDTSKMKQIEVEGYIPVGFAIRINTSN